jgi:hypothetical protein
MAVSRVKKCFEVCEVKRNFSGLSLLCCCRQNRSTWKSQEEKKIVWRSGRRLFSIACLLIIVTAMLHTIGNLSVSTKDPGEGQLIAAIQNFHFKMGMGMNPSFYELFRALTFTMSITFLALGVIGLILTGSKGVSGRVIRDVTWFYAFWNGAFTIVCYCYHVPPPLICGVLIEIVLIAGMATGAASGEEGSAKV